MPHRVLCEEEGVFAEAEVAGEEEEAALIISKRGQRRERCAGAINRDAQVARAGQPQRVGEEFRDGAVDHAGVDEARVDVEGGRAAAAERRELALGVEGLNLGADREGCAEVDLLDAQGQVVVCTHVVFGVWLSMHRVFCMYACMHDYIPHGLPAKPMVPPSGPSGTNCCNGRVKRGGARMWSMHECMRSAPRNCPKLQTMLERPNELGAFPSDANSSLIARMFSGDCTVQTCLRHRNCHNAVPKGVYTSSPDHRWS